VLSFIKKNGFTINLVRNKIRYYFAESLSIKTNREIFIAVEQQTSQKLSLHIAEIPFFKGMTLSYLCSMPSFLRRQESQRTIEIPFYAEKMKND